MAVVTRGRNGREHRQPQHHQVLQLVRPDKPVTEKLPQNDLPDSDHDQAAQNQHQQRRLDRPTNSVKTAKHFRQPVRHA